jgi:WD40 repeat protein/serine/threonine protein kinase
MSASDSPHGADRNLLFGILALQLDFVTRDALIQAMNAWVLDKTKALGQILIAQGALSSDRYTLLEALVQEHLKQHSNDPEKSLAALSSIGSVRDQLQNLRDPDVEATLTHLTKGETELSTIDAPSPGIPTSVGGRFRILRPHARGGLGEVFVARDEELHRDVALKQIQGRHADNPASRSRFVLEAEITGGLEHPGIVPVYGLGSYADGRPFYAMRFIKGDSLKDAIERYHSTDGKAKDQGERALEFRKLLGRFVDVCNAIAYAHSRGVLHRDLKPGNIMLGQYGETLVVDWGLAKAVGRPEEATGTESTLRPPAASGSSPTQAGDALGTPAYMSPEQAAGKLDDLGPASDVYSLGATLYCLLTGKPPIHELDLATAISKVQAGDIRRPREINPEVPRALEAICLRAMSLWPKDRYQSPRDLAEDIEHWLADERVTAYSEHWTGNLRRWLRKHRGMAVTSISALIIGVIGLGIATMFLSQANQRERLARKVAVDREQEAERHRQEAETAHQRAQAAQAEAEQQRDLARGVLYASQLKLAHAFWRENDLSRMKELLQATRPRAQGERDFRSFEWYYLDRQSHLDSDAQSFVMPELRAATLSQDARRLAIAEALGGRAQILEAATGQQLLAIKGAAGDALAFSPNENVLASAGWKGPIHIWDLSTGHERLVFKPHIGAIHSVAFSPDGKLLASGGEDGVIHISETTSGRIVRTVYTENKSEIYKVVFSPDGLRVASGGGGGDIYIFETSTGHQLKRLRAGEIVLGLTFGPNGRWLVSAGTDLRIWDVDTGNELHLLSGHSGWVDAIACSADGHRLVSGGRDGTVRVWELESGRELRTLRGHATSVIHCSFSPDAHHVISADRDGLVRLWIADKAAESRALPSADVSQVAFSPDGKYLACADRKAIRLYDIDTSRLVRTLKSEGDAVCLTFISRGQRLACGYFHGSVSIWDPENGRQINKFDVPGFGSIAANVDGTRLISGGYDGVVRMWDIDTGKELRAWKRHVGPVAAVGLSSGGKYIASAGHDVAIYAWEADTGVEILKGTLPEVNVGPADQTSFSPTLQIVFSPDGKTLTSAGNDGAIRRWDLPSGKERSPLKGHVGSVLTIAFSADGRRLASIGGERGSELTARIWDAETGQELLALRSALDSGWITTELPQSGFVTPKGKRFTHIAFFPSGVAFGPDGCRLAAAFGQAVRIWDGKRLTPRENTMQRAGDLVNELYDRLVLKDEVLRSLSANQAIEEPVRTAALRLAEQETDCHDPDTHAARGSAYAQFGLWKKANAEYSSAAALAPADPYIGYQHACLRLQLNDRSGYSDICKRLLSAKFVTPETSFQTAWACALSPGSVADWALLLRRAKFADDELHSSHSARALGIVLYRGGQYEAAIKNLMMALDRDKLLQHHAVQAPAGNAYSWFALALAHQKLGNEAEARQWLKKASDWTDQASKKKGADELHWNALLTLRLLRAEAEEAVNGPKIDKAGKHAKP